jgi:hypothetical protein
MAEKPQNLEAIAQHLKDARCDDETIDCFLKLYEEGKTAEQYRMLRRQRAVLLEHMHKAQQRVDCLDGFIFKFKKIVQS